MADFKKYGLLCTFLMFCSLHAHSLDTTLTGTIASRVITYTPKFGDYEYAKGFIEFANGLTCTSNPSDPAGSFVPKIGVNGPLTGTIDLSQGSMRLTDDLWLNGTFNIIGANQYPYCNKYVTDPSIFNVKGCIFLGGKTLFLDNNLTLTAGYLCFSDDGTVDGQGNTITLAGGKLMTAFNYRDQIWTMNLTLKNMTIYNANDTDGNFIQIGPGWYEGFTYLTLDNVTFKFAPNKNFTMGSMDLTIKNQVSFLGRNNIINFSISHSHPRYGAVNISHNSRLYMGQSLTFLSSFYAQDLLILFADKTSELFLDSATLYTSSANNARTFKGGTFVINGKCGLYTDTGYPTFGGSTPAEDMDILFLSGSRWEVNAAVPSSPDQAFYIRNNDATPYFHFGSSF